MIQRKVNPRTQGYTGKDVNAAVRQGIDLGVNHAIRMVLYLLLDKHGAPKEDVKELAKELEWLGHHINEGRLSWNDVDKVLHENGVGVRLR